MLLLTSSTGESIFQLVVVLLIFIIVLALTYYTTKWIAGYQKSHSYNRNLEIVETLKLTTNKYVQIVKAGNDKYLVLGIGKDEVSLLATLSSDEVEDSMTGLETNVMGDISFQEALDKFKKRLPKNGGDNEEV